MPELPEVEVVRRGLQRVLPGEEITRVKVEYAPSLQGEKKTLKGLQVTSLGRRGKMLQIHLTEDWTLLVHLRMTGQLIYVTESQQREGGGHPSHALVASLPSKHTRVVLSFGSGGKLYFNDQRKFGYLKLHPTSALDEESFLQRLGPEPWDEAFDLAYLRALCKRRAGTTIKALLLDQSVVAGLGNIYVDESLFLSGVMPSRKAGRVKKSELERLLVHIPAVLERGIEYGGVSARDYVNADGLRGRMLEQLYVYKRPGLPCKNCDDGTIEKTVVAGRGTHFCPHCQH